MKRLYIDAVKHIYLLLISLVFTQLSAQEFSFNHGGYNRPYLVHLPTGYNAANEYSLIIAFHGGLGKGSQLENQSLLSEKADEEGFIVVYPDGVPFSILNIRTWNAGQCCGGAMENDVDDVGFVEDLVDTLKNNYNIAAGKVYGTGMSNGGFLCYRIACEKPDLFAAIAPVACTMAIDDCPSEGLVPIIHFQSILDDNIPYSGGVGDGLSEQHNPPLDSVHNVWSDKGNCSFSDFFVSPDYEMKIDNSCDCGNELRYYLTSDGGHSWPGGTKSVGDDPSTVLNANDLMWEFFQQFPKSCLSSSSKVEFEASLWPNPVAQVLNVSFEGEKTIYDLTGRPIISSVRETINVEELPKGVYLLSSQYGVQTFVKK